VFDDADPIQLECLGVVREDIERICHEITEIYHGPDY
jgi:hypothetical protein